MEKFAGMMTPPKQDMFVESPTSMRNFSVRPSEGFTCPREISVRETFGSTLLSKAKPIVASVMACGWIRQVHADIAADIARYYLK